MYAKVIAAAVAVAALASPTLAQESEFPNTTTALDDGGARHDATGVECPGAMGEAPIIDILSFDREEGHLGVSCLYGVEGGGAVTLSILRADVPELVGEGTAAQRWNRIVIRTMSQSPNSMPLALGDLGAGDVEGLRAGLFEVGVTPAGYVVVGVWSIDVEGWVVHSHAQFVDNEDGRGMATDARAASIAAAEAISG